MKNPLLFLREVRQEAKKITWSNSKETMRSTLVVVAVSTLVSVFFLLADQLIKAALRFLLTLGV